MPSNLRGLNIVHPTSESSSHDLLAGPTFPDLSSQLDLWTNLSFDNEDTAISPRDENSDGKQDEEEEEGKPAAHDSHVNVVTGTVIPNQGVGQHYQPPSQQQDFDLNAFLTGFGINPYSQPPSMPTQHQQQHPPVPSLAQLLAIHAGQHPNVPFNLPISAPPPTPVPTQSGSASISAPPLSKKARTRKASVSVPPESPDDNKSAGENTLGAAEDKRRRNTAASARFRLKKKEREAALESRAKELETKVSELERECEGLRRENGWLKGLVVGVTGAQQQQQQQLSAGQKRGREDEP